jgi:Zn-dependent protease with chaperone function
MKALHPSRILYILLGSGAVLVFLLGAAAWHAVIQADPPGCSENEIACLFVPTRMDYSIHLISYALMTPLMAAIALWFINWRKQWTQINVLTKNLSLIAARDEKLDRAAASLGLSGKVRLVESDDYFSFCACPISPRIYLSRPVINALSAQELEALLLHEKYHLANRDPLKIMLGHLIVSALFFSPVLGDLFRRYQVRKEIAADQYAVSYQGTRRGIVGTLQKLLEHQSQIEKANLAVAGTEALRCRINHMLGRPSSDPISLTHVAVSFIPPALSIAIIAIPLVSRLN